MKIICDPLRLVAVITAILLMAGAILAVLGIFEELLDWELYNRDVKAMTWGVIVLGAFGVALTMVLGIWQMVTILKKNAVSKPTGKKVRAA